MLTRLQLRKLEKAIDRRSGEVGHQTNTHVVRQLIAGHAEALDKSERLERGR